MVKQIKRLPRWIRFTAHCPIKKLGIPADSIPAEISAYFGMLFAFRDLPEVRLAVQQALEFAEKELGERQDFRKVWESSPLAFRERFPSDTYQNPQTRKLFIKQLSRLERYPLPAGFGADNAPAEYHAQRQVFKFKRRTLKAARRPALPNSPQMRTAELLRGIPHAITKI